MHMWTDIHSLYISYLLFHWFPLSVLLPQHHTSLFYSLQSYYTLSSRVSYHALLYLCRLLLPCTLYLWGFCSCNIQKKSQPVLGKKKKRDLLVFYQRTPSLNGVLRSPFICLSPRLRVSGPHSSCVCRKTYFVPWAYMASNRSRLISAQVVILEERKFFPLPIFCIKNAIFYEVPVARKRKIILLAKPEINSHFKI